MHITVLEFSPCCVPFSGEFVYVSHYLMRFCSFVISFIDSFDMSASLTSVPTKWPWSGTDRFNMCQSKQHYNDVISGAIASQTTSLTIVYSIVYSDVDQRKHQSSASLAFVRGIHRGNGQLRGSPRWIPRTYSQLRGKCFHLMTSSWTNPSSNYEHEYFCKHLLRFYA